MTAAQKLDSENEMEILESKSEDLIFILGDRRIIFKSPEMGKLQCPFCNQLFTTIGKHINNQKCKISKLKLDSKELLSQLNSFKEGFRLEMSKRRKQRSMAKLLAEKGPEVIKAEKKIINLKSRAKLREEKGPEVIKAEIKKVKQKSKAKLKEEKGPEVIKAERK